MLPSLSKSLNAQHARVHATSLYVNVVPFILQSRSARPAPEDKDPLRRAEALAF